MALVWHRIRGRLRVQRIRNRVLLAMIAVSLPSLVVLGVVSYNISRDTILDINMRMTRDNLRASSDKADLLFNMINTLNRAFVLDEDLRDQLKYSNDLAHPSRRLDIHSHMQKVLNGNSAYTTYLDSVCLVNLQGDIFWLGRSDDTGKYAAGDWPGRLEREAWFRRMLEAQGRTVYVGYNVIEDDDGTFSVVKLFRDAETIDGVAIGYLFMNISKDIFRDIFNSQHNAVSNQSVVMDFTEGAGRVIHRSGDVPELAGLDSGGGFAGGIAGVIDRLKRAGYSVSAFENARTGWVFLSLTEVDELLKDAYRIETVTILIVLLIALFAVLLAFVISGGITTPLIHLKNMVLDWSAGKPVAPRTFGNDEIGVLGNTFKRVIYENQDLVDRLYHAYLKEREAELRALQAQINPHFLYNTLDSIYWMAMLDRNEKIAQMAVSLSESFKLSLNKGKETILIHKELMHIRHYMTIQNIRYNNRFTYIQNVDESLMSMEILKLLLQPLVENAITHGLEPKVGPGTVTLTGYKEGDELVFIVEDDGVGFGDMDKIESGYGLRNVRERLKLYYGESSRFEIVSEKNRGTKVLLSFNPNRPEGRRLAESRDR